MGKHDGYVVQPRGGRHIGRAWDPNAGRYSSKTFNTKAEAKAWAKEQHARFITRQDSAAKAVTSQLAADFLADLSRRKRSPAHLRDSSLVLTRLAAKLPDPTSARAATVVREWLAGMEDLAPATRNRYLVTAKSLFAWAVAEGRLHRNPLDPVKAEALDETLKDQFTGDELRALLGATADHYHLLFAVMIYTGTRIDEAVHLRWQDVDIAGRMIAIRLEGGAKIKRRRERLVPLQPELAALLLSVRPEGAAGPIFDHVGAHRGERLRAFLKRCGLQTAGRTPHSTRHTYAGLMTASGVPTALLAAYMGHKSQKTTAIYTTLAARYVASAEGWARGEFRLMEGATSPWPRVVVNLQAEGGRRKSWAKAKAARENGARFGGRPPARKPDQDLLAASPAEPASIDPAPSEIPCDS